MKNNNISIILQIIALVFLLVIGYLTFNTSSNWKVITTELNKAQEELKKSKETIESVQLQLTNAKKEFERMRVKKNLIIHQRDSLIFSFKRKNAKDWNELLGIRDSIELTNDKLAKDRLILNGLFGIKDSIR